MKSVQGFSKFSKLEKVNYIVENFLGGENQAKNQLKRFWHADENLQRTIDEFSENTLSNFYFPLGVVPNMLIDQTIYCVPMVIEESSVVAASSKSANFWLTRGGFHTEIISTKKNGQVHFIWDGESAKLLSFFNKVKNDLIDTVGILSTNMNKRGGGLLSLTLIDRTMDEKGYYQLHGEFETCDAMGANFINSILELLGQKFKFLAKIEKSFSEREQEIQVIMSILSNYTPECLVRCSVECDISELADPSLGMTPEEFADKFARAIRISKIDVSRATTHNKGIMNGVDAVVLATGNDFRAVEAGVHTYAARDGQYRGLSNVEIQNNKFKFSLDLPIAIGTVGGLTSLHPMAKLALDILGRPSAHDLMRIIASIGLAQNFAAIRSLVTSGIQKGHMKMHLMNILNHLESSDNEREKAKEYFSNEIISFQSVREYIISIRNYQ